MSVNSRKFKRNIRKFDKIQEIKEKLEVESDIIYLECLKFDLNTAKKHAKLQRKIHKKQGWRDYTC